jgi:nitroreductase
MTNCADYEPDTAQWSPGEIDVIARAVVWAPSVHNSQPWRLELPGREALLYARDVDLPQQDRSKRDVAISCGTALANLELAVRALGLELAVSLAPDAASPDLVARIETGGRRPPTGRELHRYSAIARRRSYRLPFSGQEVSEHALHDIIVDAAGPGVQIRPLADDEGFAVAGLLEHAACLIQHDAAYQRELAVWTTPSDASPLSGLGMAPATLRGGSLPWAGLVRPGTAVPDRVTLADRLASESILVVLTAGDSPLDHVSAGIAIERAWLAAVDLGLVGAILTQPLQLSEVRSGFIERLELPGYPQALLRVGHPSGPAPQSPRHKAEDLLARSGSFG